MDTELKSFPLEAQFVDWLHNASIYSAKTIQSKTSNLRTINRFYGSLVSQWEKDNFQSLLSNLSYSKNDETVGVQNPSGIPIEGNIYNGLATYRYALNLYKTFLSSSGIESVGYPFGEIGLKVHKALKRLSEVCKKRVGYSRKEVKTEIIEPLLLFLDEELGSSMQYTFSSELIPVDDNGIKKTNDRYDIFGQSKDKPVIIVEVDTHRSDQMSKKVVSRIALNADKEVLYVCVLYPNTHDNRSQEIKECNKYINFLNILFSLFSEPQKSFMYHWIS